MSRTRRGSKGPGHEYWSRRSLKHGEVPGKDAKRRAARAERRQGKKEGRQED